MRWFLIGVVVGVLIAVPAAGAAVVSAAAVVVAQPLVLAFVLGLVVRPALARRLRRWAR